jgi:hypothetical protein
VEGSDDVATTGLNVAVSEADLDFQSDIVFPAPSYPGDECAEVRAGDIMANADVGLAHSEKHSIGDGTAKRRLGRAAQCGLTDAIQARK